MPTKCCWVIHGGLTSERKASTSPSSFINHSTLLLNRALKRQAPCLYMHFEVRALDRLSCRVRTRRRVGSARRRGNHMHDHSRFQRDINDVTGVSLSLSLSLSLKSLTHNIGSASALPIINHDSGDVDLLTEASLRLGPINYRTSGTRTAAQSILPFSSPFSERSLPGLVEFVSLLRALPCNVECPLVLAPDSGGSSIYLV